MDNLVESKVYGVSNNQTNLMKESINLINVLKDGGVEDFVSLPSIAVIGIQSSGKSSVLEGLIGLDILPRADGLCTRTPIELRLNTSTEEYAVIRLVNGPLDRTEFDLRVDILEDLKRIIVEQTDFKAGTKKNIVDRPIIVSVYSPKCPDLTVIDLPGIVNNPLEGSDQPKDIDEITWKITKKYCEKENTIMLCVLASGVDITTSEILRYAKKIDPEGKRTMGVLTKLDLMNEGTSAKEALLGQQVKLGLGFIAVRNRTQKELNVEKIGLQESYEREINYFSSHPVYKRMKDHTGTPTLLTKVSKVLFQEIKKNIPNILGAINNKIEQIEKELKVLGPGVPMDFINKKKLINKLTDDFCTAQTSLIMGRYSDTIDENFEYGGYQIVERFEKFLEKESKPEYKVSDDYSDEYIADRLKRLYGDSFRGQISTHSFHDLLKPQIEKLRKPILEFLTEVESLLCNLSFENLKVHFSLYPNHGLGMSQFVNAFIKNKIAECKNILMRNIDILKTPFTNDITYHTTIDLYIFERTRRKIVPEIKNQNQSVKNEEYKFDLNDEDELVYNEAINRISDNKSINMTSKLPNTNNIQDNKAKGVNIATNNTFDTTLTYDEKIQEMRYRMDKFFSLCVVNKLRDLVPAAVSTIVLNEVCSEVRNYLNDSLEDNKDFVETLSEEDEAHDKRKSLVYELRKLEELRKIILLNPSGSNSIRLKSR